MSASKNSDVQNTINPENGTFSKIENPNFKYAIDTTVVPGTNKYILVPG